jgi:hypothetical protein
VDYTTFTHLAGSNLEHAAKLWGILNAKYIVGEDPRKIKPIYTNAIYNYKNETDYLVPGLNLIKRFPPCEDCHPEITLLYENEGFLPRIYLVNRSILIIGEKDKLLGIYGFLLLNNNFDPRTTVLINKENIKDEDLDKYSAIIIARQVNQGEIYKLGRFKDSGGTILPDIFNNERELNPEKLNALLSAWNKEPAIKGFKEIDYSQNHRIYGTEGKLKGFAVISENFYTYRDIWQIMLNSEKKEIYSANYVVSAVYLDSEGGRLEFKFNPIYFKIGSIISVITLLAVIAALVFVKKSQKQKI